MPGVQRWKRRARRLSMWMARARLNCLSWRFNPLWFNAARKTAHGRLGRSGRVRERATEAIDRPPGEADRAVLKTLAAHFPDLGAEADPLARLMSARLAPGPATLLLAAAQAGADEVRLRRLKEALARLLK